MTPPAVTNPETQIVSQQPQATRGNTTHNPQSSSGVSGLYTLQPAQETKTDKKGQGNVLTDTHGLSTTDDVLDEAEIASKDAEDIRRTLVVVLLAFLLSGSLVAIYHFSRRH